MLDTLPALPSVECVIVKMRGSVAVSDIFFLTGILGLNFHTIRGVLGAGTGVYHWFVIAAMFSKEAWQPHATTRHQHHPHLSGYVLPSFFRLDVGSECVAQ